MPGPRAPHEGHPDAHRNGADSQLAVLTPPVVQLVPEAAHSFKFMDRPDEVAAEAGESSAQVFLHNLARLVPVERTPAPRRRNTFWVVAKVEHRLPHALRQPV